MKILIVDDEPLVRRSLEKVFDKKGFDVQVASDGHEAVEAWGRFHPDAVVIDVLMPGLSGPEVIAEVSPPPSTSVVLISAYSGEYNPDSVRQLGADLFIEKPFDDIQKVVEAVNQLISRKKV